ncbi:MAG: CPBP family intramembrane glutamic endopeptidase [Pseudomonadota bacterium]
MVDVAASPALPSSRLRLWAELLSLFVGVPILMWVFFEQIRSNGILFATIWVLAGVALLLLWQTPGWRWRSMFRGPVLSEWPILLAVSALTALAALTFIFTMRPDIFLHLPKLSIFFWLVVMTFYPLLSAFPQEIIYRALFFERYQGLLSNTFVLIALNGFLFGFGHLFYETWITIVMTTIGGAIMGWAYLRARSMMLAWVIHALCGQIVFTSGLGVYFYSGMVGNL